MKVYLLSIALLFSLPCFCVDEQPINVITFELQGGKKIDVLSFSSLSSGDLRSFSVTTTDGKKLLLLDKDIVSRKEERVPLAKLPEGARKELQRIRAVAAASRAEADAQAAEQKALIGVKRRENDARAAVSKAQVELTLSQSLIVNADAIVKNTPIEVAKADARYDAAKTELGAASSFVPMTASRADWLRNQMSHAAEDKARLELAKREAEEITKRALESTKVLNTRFETARKELDAAEAETKQSIQKLKASREQKADKKVDDELSIRRTDGN